AIRPRLLARRWPPSPVVISMGAGVGVNSLLTVANPFRAAPHTSARGGPAPRRQGSTGAGPRPGGELRPVRRRPPQGTGAVLRSGSGPAARHAPQGGRAPVIAQPDGSRSGRRRTAVTQKPRTEPRRSGAGHRDRPFGPSPWPIWPERGPARDAAE